jgi:glycosyltransferase involved in cell wall biosynthesis
VLYPHKQNRKLLILEMMRDGNISRYQFKLSRALTPHSLRHSEFAHWFSECIRRLGVEVVHIQHWLRLSPVVFQVPMNLGVPYFVTLHDFYALCPNERLMTPQNRFCELKEKLWQCSCCLWQTKKRGRGFLRQWQMTMKQALGAANQIFAPSDYMRRMAQTVYPDISITVIPHGLDQVETEDAEDKTPDSPHEPNPGVFRVAVLGHLQPAKGSELLLRTLILNRDETIEFHSFGQILDQTLAARSGKIRSPLIAHGPYDRNDIVKLLQTAEISLALFLSLQPEIFSYTLSEAMAAKCPVLALDLGAVGDRIQTSGCGWLMQPDASPESILTQIEWIRTHPEAYLQAKQAIRDIAWTSAEEMAEIYQKHYVVAKSAAGPRG